MPHMCDPDSHLTIGEAARESGLTASALRLYDREGVLVPADVDPLTGYRRYAVSQVRAARLLASLRRIGMPLVEGRLVLDEDARGARRSGRGRAVRGGARSPGRRGARRARPACPDRSARRARDRRRPPRGDGPLPARRRACASCNGDGDGDVPGHAGTLDVAALHRCCRSRRRRSSSTSAGPAATSRPGSRAATAATPRAAAAGPGQPTPPPSPRSFPRRARPTAYRNGVATSSKLSGAPRTCGCAACRATFRAVGADTRSAPGVPDTDARSVPDRAAG